MTLDKCLVLLVTQPYMAVDHTGCCFQRSTWQVASLSNTWKLTTVHPLAATVTQLQAAANEAHDALWWPFTQHASIQPGSVTVIDGRHGDDFAVLADQPQAAASLNQQHQQQTAQQQPQQLGIGLQHDACASWWTQVHTIDLSCTVRDGKLPCVSGSFSIVVCDHGSQTLSLLCAPVLDLHLLLSR